MRVEDLPLRIRKKIDTASVPGCWIWTGAVTKGRQRVRPYHRSQTTGDRHRNFSHFTTVEKSLPMCQDPAVGYPVPAHRRVYGLSQGLPTPLVPRLGRCAHELCVNPLHCRPVEDPDAPVRRMTTRLVRPDVPLNPALTAPGDILERLKAVRPAAFLSPESAAEEANCPVPDAQTWAAYLAWDATTPEEVE